MLWFCQCLQTITRAVMAKSEVLDVRVAETMALTFQNSRIMLPCWDVCLQLFK